MKQTDQETVAKPTSLNLQRLHSESNLSSQGVSKCYLVTDFAQIPEESMNPINSDELRR